MRTFRSNCRTPAANFLTLAQSLDKAQLHRQLVELRADHDAIVLSVAKVSVGSVVQSGQEFIRLVPADAPLEVEGNIAGNDDGFVNVGDSVALKFDTFPYTEYGMAYGTVRTLSANSFTTQDEQSNPTGAVPLPPNALCHFSSGHGSRLIALTCVGPQGVPAAPGHASDGGYQGR